MCGFAATNYSDPSVSNDKCVKRGPDLTTVENYEGIWYLHNVLHITGEVTPQPIKRNDTVAVFNGEIYNYTDFGSYNSDGECIVDLYNTHGETFCKLLDGEYALFLVDYAKRKLIISTDTFACKPLWYEFKQDKFCVATYKSQLDGLGFTNSKKLYANKTQIYNLDTLTLVNEYDNFKFDITQKNNSFDGWCNAFSNSIKKRTQNTTQGMFLGLSSGFDSGAIACELNKQGTLATGYSIVNNENPDIMKARFDILPSTVGITLSDAEFQKWKKVLRHNCEDFVYDDGVRNYNIKGDQAVQGLAAICSRANANNQRIYFSGQGADEIISDYGFNGKRIYKHSQFGGKFPNTLEGFWPWHSFWDGTQIQYLNKEEYIAGHFGIETRYPFLDKYLVQEFLWLTPELKNSKYKSCLAYYLSHNNFPYEANEKRGFNIVAKGKKKKTLKIKG